MSVLKEIIEDIRQHAYECEELDFGIDENPLRFHRQIKCSCGKFWEVSLSDVMASNGKEEYDSLINAIQGCNTPAFRQARVEWRKKRQAEKEREMFLKKRKSAIGSLEL